MQSTQSATNPPTIFRCKTHNGHIFKVLTELLQHNNIKTVPLEIKSSGIYLRTMDDIRTILIDVELSADRFEFYKFTPKDTLYVGIRVSILQKMLKSIKKKDSIELFIIDAQPEQLGIKVFPKDGKGGTNSFIQITNVQNIATNLPIGYKRPIIAASTDFQKMCKNLSQISETATISIKGFQIYFNGLVDGVMGKSYYFGEADEEGEAENLIEDYNEEFTIEKLVRVSKIAGLSSNLQIYTVTGNPLKISSDVGTIGKISVYVKSKGDIETDSRTIESEDD